MQVIDVEQRSPEWFALRQHRLTASRFDTVMHGTMIGWKRTMHGMRRKTEQKIDAPALSWGRQHEGAALGAYTMETTTAVNAVGFVIGADTRYGASPDALVGRYGVAEIKCPYNQHIHIKTFGTRTVPPQYVAQCQGLIWITERAWCDFVSFDPRSFDSQRIVVVRVRRDSKYISRLKERCELFMRFYEDRVDPTKQIHVPKLF